jgi:hypothetical protein
LLREATARLAGQVQVQARRSVVLLDGFLAPTGERAGVADMYSGKRHAAGLNVQAVADLDGRLVDTGLPVPGARHDSEALAESGIADRWAGHLRPDGPGVLADLGYLGTAAITGTANPEVATSPTSNGPATPRSTGFGPPSNGRSHPWSTGRSSTPDGVDT